MGMTDEQQAPDTETPDSGVHDDAPGTSGVTGASGASDATGTTDASAGFEPLTAEYERVRHSTDAAELSAYARRPLPDRADQAAFSRATALLEAVAGNRNTPVEDRIYLAATMPFPNVLVKLSEDPEMEVRRAVAGNKDDKNWLVGRLTKDAVPEVRDAALTNPKTSWKMRLEGAQNPQVDAATLDYLAQLGVELEPKAPAVLSSMVRRAVALNPNTTPATLARLAQDESDEVRHAARKAAGLRNVPTA